MIRSTQRNIKSASFHFLLWGWVVILGNLGHFYLQEFTNYPYPYAIWLLTIPAWLISMIYGYRQPKIEKVKMYSDSLIMWIWLGFLFSILLIIFSGLFGSTIPFIILVLAGLCTFLTGLVLKFKPLIYGGSSFWIFAAISIAIGQEYITLISALATLVGYLVPGYLIRKSN
ncbi:hypothetical protein [Fulvivirga lutea]|uniref:Uncharacterized protein n=1 Tax=Fulvivirga lutea TaxID=2810512 RepID=A0A974WGR5_9BACT|nr:hypothetical protein [Fulvivirga lutea]QSE96907.1 hypothetical protein JR347_15100 [Fulvivirga lutea]